MRIDGHPASREAAQVQPDPIRPERGAVARPAGPGSDRVALSTDLQLVESARRAAEESPEVRQALVERMQQKLVAGELGQDLFRLADRLIDHLPKL